MAATYLPGATVMNPRRDPARMCGQARLDEARNALSCCISRGRHEAALAALSG